MISNLTHIIKRNWRTAGLVLAMAAGIFFPQIHVLTFLVRYMIMTMLFFAFLNLNPEQGIVHRSHVALLAAAPLLAFASYAGLIHFDRDAALAAFLIALTPAATASPVVTALLGGNPAYTAFMVFTSSIIQPLIIALTLPLLLGGKNISGIGTMLATILSTIVIPFVIARSIARLRPALSGKLRKAGSISFVLWISVVCIAISESSFFLRHIEAPHVKLAIIAAATLVLCILQFSIGRMIGGKRFGIEAGQSLGQKNTVFTIWVALTFVSPLVSLGPAFYIICHNSWNAWQLHRQTGKH